MRVLDLDILVAEIHADSHFERPARGRAAPHPGTLGQKYCETVVYYEDLRSISHPHDVALAVWLRTTEKIVYAEII